MTNDNEIWNNDNDVFGVMCSNLANYKVLSKLWKGENTGFRVISVLNTD